MDDTLKEFYLIAKSLKESGRNDDDIRIALLENGLDIQGIESVLIKLSSPDKRDHRKKGLINILIGLIFIIGSLIFGWTTIFSSEMWSIYLLLCICIWGMFKITVGIIRLF